MSKLLGKYALISALEDDRFDPISLKEVKSLSVGLSLLVNFKKIKNPLDFEIGKHGVEIEFKAEGETFSSTFLPEVMEEEGWDQLETLDNLIEKSGYWDDTFQHESDPEKRLNFEGNWTSYDDIKHLIKAKTYESIKHKMSY